MRPNNRQRSRGGRNGGGGGGNHNQHKQHHNHNPNRPPNRNQIFDSSGPDVRVRGNAHQVFDKYQSLAREAAAMGDRIQSEAYWQYADHYYRVIQTMGGFTHRNNQGWGEGGEEGQQNPQNQQQDGQSSPQQQNAGPNGHANGEGGGEGYEQAEQRPQQQHNRSERAEQRGERGERGDRGDRGESEPGLGGVAFLQSGRSAPQNQDPAAEDQPDVPEFRPASGRRGG
ncbi:MAG: DUF4167 domain-containing protein [Proteobacteria bacterium]|nr:DUF4167 domain-containing protein [Pseudomonadota bacterium]MBS0548451.1 DUF4167 domain-containing protein [Pseudomonadota bacterium]